MNKFLEQHLADGIEIKDFSHFKLFNLIQNYYKAIEWFPYSTMDINKPKQAEEAFKCSEKVSKTYPEVRKWCQDIEVCLLLGCNDVIINALTESVGNLHKAIVTVNSTYDTVKSNQHVNTYYQKEVKPLMKEKPLLDALIHDLTMIADKHGFMIDKKQISYNYKSNI